MENIIQMRPCFMSPESVKNIACAGKKTNEIDKKDQSPYDLLKNAQKNIRPN